MSKASKVPYTWPEIEAQVRECVLAQASIIGLFGPQDGKIVAAFLGIDAEDERLDPLDHDDERMATFDLKRHYVFHVVERAYAYAYQLDGWEDAMPEDWHEVGCGLLNGYAQTDIEGVPNGLEERNDPPLRRVLDTFFARWNWTHHGSGLTVRQLGLLANMPDQSVRSSLSKEGFRMEPRESDEEDSRNELSSGQAIQWLSKRRGFIPNRGGVEPELRKSVVYEILKESYFSSLPTVLTRILDAIGMSMEQLIERADVPEPWLRELAAGKVVSIDIEALKKVADALDASSAIFVGFATMHLVETANLQAAANSQSKPAPS